MQECKKGRFLTIFFLTKGKKVNVTAKNMAFSPGHSGTQTHGRGGQECVGAGKEGRARAGVAELSGFLRDLPGVHLFTSLREVRSEAELATVLSSKIRQHEHSVSDQPTHPLQMGPQPP